jgi:hypothetical protein
MAVGMYTWPGTLLNRLPSTRHLTQQTALKQAPSCMDASMYTSRHLAQQTAPKKAPSCMDASMNTSRHLAKQTALK